MLLLYFMEINVKVFLLFLKKKKKEGGVKKFSHNRNC